MTVKWTSSNHNVEDNFYFMKLTQLSRENLSPTLLEKMILTTALKRTTHGSCSIFQLYKSLKWEKDLSQKLVFCLVFFGWTKTLIWGIYICKFSLIYDGSLQNGSTGKIQKPRSPNAAKRKLIFQKTCPSFLISSRSTSKSFYRWALRKVLPCVFLTSQSRISR